MDGAPLASLPRGHPCAQTIAQQAHLAVEFAEVGVEMLDAPRAAEAGVPADAEAARKIVGVVTGVRREIAGLEVA